MSIEKLFEAEAARAYARGQREATSIDLGESGYGSCRTAIVAVEFSSLRVLVNHIRERRWRTSGENPGHAFAGTCRLIHIHTGDYSKVALLECSTLYDI